MGKSTAKGTRYENHVREMWLSRVWPNAKRAAKEGIHDKGDFVGVNGWMVEAKWRKTTKGWRIASWMRTLKRKQQTYDPTAPIVLFVGSDKRAHEGFPFDLVVIPAEQYIEQLRRLSLLGQETP